MDLASILSTYLALSGMHSLNHLSESNKTGAPSRFDFHGSPGEKWIRPDNEYEKVKQYSGFDENGDIYIDKKGNPLHLPAESSRNSAGFVGQDELNQAMNTPESSAANALSKLLYIGGAHKLLSGSPTYKDADIGGIAENTGISRGRVNALVGATAAFNAIKAGNFNALKDYDLSVSPLDSGGFGLIFTKKF